MNYFVISVTISLSLSVPQLSTDPPTSTLKVQQLAEVSKSFLDFNKTLTFTYSL